MNGQDEQPRHPDAVDQAAPGSRGRVSRSWPAAAGIGRPMKYFLSTTCVWMLKRARRIEPHTTKRNDTSQPSREKVGQAPRVGEHRRGDAEGDEVGERVVLLAELGGGVGHARDPAVERVEDRRDDDEVRGGLEGAADRAPDRQVAAEQVADGEERRRARRAAGEPLPRERRIRPAAAGHVSRSSFPSRQPRSARPDLSPGFDEHLRAVRRRRSQRASRRE